MDANVDKAVRSGVVDSGAAPDPDCLVRLRERRAAAEPMRRVSRLIRHGTSR